MTVHGIEIDTSRLEDFCRRWKIKELALFGSVLREDHTPKSDIDLLVSFSPEADWDLFDLVDARHELESLLGRKVDLVERRALVNPFRRREILGHHEVLYAA